MAGPRSAGSASVVHEAGAHGIFDDMDDRVDWVSPDGAFYDTQVGPQALAENVLAAVAGEFTDFSVTVDEYVDGGDVVCAIGRYGGTASETSDPARHRPWASRRMSVRRRSEQP